MKKALLLAALLALALLALLACNATPPDENGEGTTTTTTAPTEPPIPVGNFTIVAEERVLYAGRDGNTIALSVTGEDATEDAVVTYQLVGATRDASVDENGVVTFTDITFRGVEVQAVIDGKVSRNTITLYNVQDKSDRVTKLLNDQGFGSLELGQTISLSAYLPLGAYTISLDDAAEGSLRIHTDAADPTNHQIEAIGISKAATLTLLDADGEVYWSGTCNNASTAIGSAIRASAIRSGVATADTPSITPAMMASMTTLTCTNLQFDTIEGWAFLSRFPALTALTLERSPIFDLSFLAGRTQLATLSLHYLPTFDLKQGEALLSAIDSMTALKGLSILGTIGVLDRDLCTALLGRVKAGRFSLAVLEDLTLTQASPDGFLDTVFFSMAEIKAHTSEHEGKLIPANGYHHAILTTVNDENYSAKISVYTDSALKTLALFGKTRMSLYPASDLTIDLYNCYWYANANEGDKLLSSANLTINGRYGWSCIEGSDSVWWTTDGHTWCYPHTSAVVCKDLNVYAAPGATLAFRGGAGNEGYAGKSDGSNPDSSTSQKHGTDGDWGKAAVDVDNLVVLGGTIEFVGGTGGPGGDGADGNDYNIFNGGYNAGDGGDGGRGGAGIRCKTYTAAEGASVVISGGYGGLKGDGGSGYLLGSDGENGTPGSVGPQIEYK